MIKLTMGMQNIIRTLSGKARHRLTLRTIQSTASQDITMTTLTDQSKSKTTKFSAVDWVAVSQNPKQS